MSEILSTSFAKLPGFSCTAHRATMAERERERETETETERKNGRVKFAKTLGESENPLIEGTKSRFYFSSVLLSSCTLFSR